METQTTYFDIVVGVRQGDILAPHLFIICQDYGLRMSIDLTNENGFKQNIRRTNNYGRS